MAMSNGSEPGMTARVSRKRVLRGTVSAAFSPILSSMILLSRDDFRAQVFARDRNRCVCCGRPAQDAHHILERRLFPDGGYYLANGATLCGPCHLKAESTELSCDEIRVAAGICEAVLPPHLYHDRALRQVGQHHSAHGTTAQGGTVRRSFGTENSCAGRPPVRQPREVSADVAPPMLTRCHQGRPRLGGSYR